MSVREQHEELNYRFNGGQYVLHRGDTPVGPPLDEVALAIDRAEGNLCKHGAAALVDAWAEQTRKVVGSLRTVLASMRDQWAEDLVVVCGRFPLEELNRCLSTTGYAGRLLASIQAGEIEPVPLDPSRVEQDANKESTTMVDFKKLLQERQAETPQEREARLARQDAEHDAWVNGRIEAVAQKVRIACERNLARTDKERSFLADLQCKAGREHPVLGRIGGELLSLSDPQRKWLDAIADRAPAPALAPAPAAAPMSRAQRYRGG